MSELSRRSFLRASALALGAAIASSSLQFARRAVAAVAARTTATASIIRGTAGAGGYSPLVDGPALERVIRTELGAQPATERAACRRGILGFVQFSDVHVVDHQSPMRVEWLDRYEDAATIPGPGLLSSSYRPHEMLTAQVSDAMVRAVNALPSTPVLSLPVSFVVETGDNSDNSQFNEIRWNVDLLDGGAVQPDSGDLTKYEGVMASADPNYWHPEGDIPSDSLRATYGFPTVPGLLDAARQPFTAAGLSVDWYSVFGNHDGLVQGNFPTNPPMGPLLNAIAVGGLKLMSPPAGFSQANLDDLLNNQNLNAILTPLLASIGTATPVTADADRRLLTRGQVVDEHFNTSGTPVGHGFTAQNQADDTAYYVVDKGPVLLVMLDTVNPNGYADGSLDAAQFEWLKGVVDGAASKLVVLFSHHTSTTMGNPLVLTGGDPASRVVGDDVVAYLVTRPQVIAWVNGHTHRNEIWAHPAAAGGFWEINTASHIDFPQQARIIEIADNLDGTLSIFTTILDHAAPAAFDGNLTSVDSLASLSRELSANDPQLISSGLAGTPGDLNVELLVKRPPGFVSSASCDSPTPGTPGDPGTTGPGTGASGDSGAGGSRRDSDDDDGDDGDDDDDDDRRRRRRDHDGELPDAGGVDVRYLLGGVGAIAAGEAVRRAAKATGEPADED
jgi:metallophosphoesterase (TIGR03767 family)